MARARRARRRRRGDRDEQLRLPPGDGGGRDRGRDDPGRRPLRARRAARARLGARRRAVGPHHRHRLRRHRRRDRRGAGDDARARRPRPRRGRRRWRSCRRRWSTSRSPTARRSPARPRSGRRSSARRQALEGRGRVLAAPLGHRAAGAGDGRGAERRGGRRGLRAPCHAWSAKSSPRRRGLYPSSPPMCGIVGYVGGRPCRDLLVAGLEKLEYRGYDSAGISVIDDGRIDSVRAVGNLANLRAAVERAGRGRRRRRGRRAAGDDRRRPHPLGDPRPRHRGERPPARRLLRPRPHRPQRDRREPRRAAPRARRARASSFSSETDAEIVAHLIERHYDGDLAAAVRASFAELRGHYAFVAMHADEPGLLVGARKECPLVAGVGEGESFLASAIPAFLAETRDAVRDRERRDRHHRRLRRDDHRRRGQPGRARAPRRSPGTRTPPRRAATRPSC